MNRGAIAIVLVCAGAMLIRTTILNAAAPSQVPVPCREAVTGAGNKYLRPCDSGGGTAPSGVIPQIRADFKQRILNEIDAIYDKGVVTQGDTTSTTDPNFPASYFGKPTCNLFGDAFSKGLSEGLKPDVDVNNRGDSCGDFLKINVDVDVGFTGTDTKTAITVGAVVGPDGFTKGPGSREIALRRGAWIHSLYCAWKKLDTEVAAKSIHITPGANSGDGGCAALAEATNGSLNSGTSGAANLTADLTENADRDIANIWKCDTDQWTITDSTGKLDVGKLRQSATQLCASRAGLEGAFGQLVVCEAFYQAGQKYKQAVGDETTFLTEAKAAVAKPCEDQCNSQCNGGCAVSWHPSRDCTDCATTCANSCYRTKLLEWLKTVKFNGIWPAGSCSLDTPRKPDGNLAAGFPGFVFPASLLIGRRRRRRAKSGAPRMSRTGATVAAMFSVMFYGVISIGGACGGAVAGVYNDPAKCPPGDSSLGGLPAECCKAGALIDPPPDNCKAATPYTGGVGGGIRLGGLALGGSNIGLGNSKDLARIKNGSAADLNPEQQADLAKGLEANAGGTLAPASGRDVAKSGGGGDSGNKNAGKRVAGANGSANGPGGNGLGNGKTGVLSDGSDGGGGPSTSADTAGGSYGGGGAGGGAGGGGAGGAGYGAGAGGGLTATGDTADFGGKTDADGTNVKGSDDPEDYFTRIGLDESIFLRVKKRYTAKSTQWAKELVEPAAAAVLKTKDKAL